MTDGVKDAKENFEMAIVAGKDISRVLDLDPPVNTVFESNAKGAGLTKARAKFTDAVDAEIIDLCQAMDGEKYLVVPADIPNFAPETQEYLKTILQDEVRDRLFPPVDEKKGKRGKTSKVSKAIEKDRFGFRIGTKASQAMALLETGENSMVDVIRIMGHQYSGDLGKVRKRGFTVIKGPDGKITIK